MKTSPNGTSLDSRKTQSMQQCILSPLPFVTGRLCPHSARPIKTTSTNIVKVNSTSGAFNTSQRWPSDRAVGMTSKKVATNQNQNCKTQAGQPVSRTKPNVRNPASPRATLSEASWSVLSDVPLLPGTPTKNNKTKTTHPTIPTMTTRYRSKLKGGCPTNYAEHT